MFSHIKELFTRPSGYTISRSVRLRSSASAYFSRTPASASNRTVWTWSGWAKRGQLGTYQALFDVYVDTNNASVIDFTDTNNLRLNNLVSGVAVTNKITNAVYRDTSAWYHIVVSSNGATALNLYVNGVQVTSWGTNTGPDASNWFFNSTNTHWIGREQYSTSNYYTDGYLTEINFIDGQALTPSSFGSTNATTGVWQPAKYTGTYGTNGFYLNFSDNSSNTATTIGKDYSGNGNNWTPNNISVTSGVTYDSMVDSPTVSAVSSNYCVGNTLDNSGTLSSGNLTFVSGGSNQSNRATFQLPSSGKFYAECTLGTTTSASVGEAFGYATASASLTGTPNSSGKYVIYADSTGGIYSNGSTLTSSLGTFASGTVLQIAYDGNTGNAWVGKNNTWYNSTGGTTGDPSAGSNPTFTSLSSVFPFTQGINATQNLNFGQQPFSYTPPTGFVALNTYNLPASTITNGAAYMAATLYTGAGGTQTITNTVNGVSFQPDFVWGKARSVSYSNALFDSVRGFGSAKGLVSNLTQAEGTTSAQYGYVSTNTSTGFTATGGTDATNPNASLNESGVTYVAWQWKAGGTSSSNTNGSITSTVSVGATQGFSVVTWTNPASGTPTIGHGLGVAPTFIIVKDRTFAYNWDVGCTSIGWANRLNLNSTSATSSGFWNSTAPTSTVFTYAASGANSGDSMVAYCFAAVKGFSAFGSYTGNGSADGPFVYTGFRPRFVLIKSAGAVQPWNIFDSSRDTYNVEGQYLQPNSSGAEGTAATLDFTSNGFKLRTSGTYANGSADTLIYAAFAENPFKNALAR